MTSAGTDPLGALALRLASTTDPKVRNAIAYEPATLQLARLLLAADPAGYEDLLAAIKSVGVRTGPWEKRVRTLPERPAVVLPHELEGWLPAHPDAAYDPAVLRAAAALEPAFRPALERKLAVAGVDLARWQAAVAAEQEAARARAAADAAAPPPEATWTTQLRCGKDGTPLATFGNVCLILRHAPAYAGRFAFDEMTLQPCLADAASASAALGDAGIGRLREALERDFDVAPHPEALTAALLTVAHERPFHPVRAYLDALAPWDGDARIARLATEVLGLPAGEPETVFAATLLRKWLIAAVRRVRKPGEKVDTALVLVGPQGHKKSTFFSVLAGPFFVDCDMDLESKDAVLQLRAGWIVEWGEIERVTSRKQAEVVKAFVSRAEDVMRAPYARGVARYPRASLIAGSTNKTEFLVDETGERRFWVIDIGRAHINADVLRAWRDQVWAEAVAACEAGDTAFLDQAADVATHGELTKAYRRADAWQVPIEQWLLKVAAWTDTAEVLERALEIRKGDFRDEHTTRVGRVMAALGWERKRAPRHENPKRPWRYYRPAPDEPPRAGPGDPPSGAPPAVPNPAPPVPDGDPSKSSAGPSGPSGIGGRAHVREERDEKALPTPSLSLPLSTRAPSINDWDHRDHPEKNGPAQFSGDTGTGDDATGPPGPLPPFDEDAAWDAPVVEF